MFIWHDYHFFSSFIEFEEIHENPKQLFRQIIKLPLNFGSHSFWKFVADGS